MSAMSTNWASRGMRICQTLGGRVRRLRSICAHRSSRNSPGDPAAHPGFNLERIVEERRLAPRDDLISELYTVITT